MPVAHTRFRDKRTGKTVTRFSILSAGFMEKVKKKGKR